MKKVEFIVSPNTKVDTINKEVVDLRGKSIDLMIKHIVRLKWGIVDRVVFQTTPSYLKKSEVKKVLKVKKVDYTATAHNYALTPDEVLIAEVSRL